MTTYTPYNLPQSGYLHPNDVANNSAGNNPYGSLGRQKCTACRERRKKCEWDESNPQLPCVYCHRQGHTTCQKVFSPSRQLQNAATNIPSPPSETTEFRASDICIYYESLYSQATPEQIAQLLAKHVADQRRQDEQEAIAQAAAAAAAQHAAYAQNAMVPGQQTQYTGYPTATQYQGGYQQGYGTDQSQQYGVVDPALLNQQVPGSFFPQQPYGYGGNSF